MTTTVLDIAEAADLVAKSRRIVVTGCSGSGKSTLSTALSRRFSLPYISLDRDVFWLPGWRLRPREEAIELMTAHAQGERWIMDGNSPRTMNIRLNRADLVIWLRPPRHVSVSGILRRWWRYRGTVRPGMPEGCPEKIDWAFFSYVWNFERNEVPKFMAAFEAARADLPVVILKSHRDTAKLLDLAGVPS
ncbi:AAA family ATPase [Rhizobium paknamense]|uniref:Adenylate kinase family enzyme n=1 Tax=Rhizobium paknamense TaxID=1206817 RepID=A0ABU0I8A6_9HYPH|nr:AAA family ATPase [Rhizobium paknamense]MDQ0453710.1 adenylate kinase family enzyme [Rhizobium paknamense]